MYLYVKLNWDANFFFPAESKDCMNSASYEYRNMSARRGAQFVPIGMPTICWKTFPPKTTKMLSTRNSSMLTMSSSVYCFLSNLSVPWQNRVLRDLKPEICICDSHFCDYNKRVPDDSCKSAFKFMARNGCVKGRKIKGLNACDMVEIWRLKMF